MAPLLRILAPFHMNVPTQTGKKTMGSTAYTMYGTFAPAALSIHCGV